MSLFANAQAAVAELRADRLLTVGASYFPDAQFSGSYLLGKLRAAEKDAEHKLRIFLEPVEVLPEGTPQADIDALEAAGTRYVEEPAYDWDPDFFTGNRWGLLQLRRQPLIRVDDVRFVYPSTQESMYRFPKAWIRLDKKYGEVRIVPTGEFSALPLNAWLLRVFGAGRMVPHMLRVRYAAGLKDAAYDYPELIDTIKKMAVLRILNDQFLPSSGSISADGLSQSISMDSGKYQEQIDGAFKSLRQELFGVRVMAV